MAHSHLKHTRIMLLGILLTFLTNSAQAQWPLPPEDMPIRYTAYLPLITTPEPQNGAAWAAAGRRHPRDAEILHIAWYHNWGPVGANLENGAVFVPTLWCDRYPPMDWADGTNLLQRMTEVIPANYTGPILFINEPDLPGSDTGGQCDRTPEQAAWLYYQLRLAFPRATLVGPQPSHLDYVNGWPWLRAFYDFLSSQGWPPPDVATIHTYIDTEPPGKIVDSLFALLSAYPDAPHTAWVTEYGSCNPGIIHLMRSYWQSDARITRWAFFTPRWWDDGACLSAFTDPFTYVLSPVGQALAPDN